MLQRICSFPLHCDSHLLGAAGWVYVAVDFTAVSKTEGVYQVSGSLGYGGCVVLSASGVQHIGGEGKGGCKGTWEGAYSQQWHFLVLNAMQWLGACPSLWLGIWGSNPHHCYIVHVKGMLFIFVGGFG